MKIQKLSYLFWLVFIFSAFSLEAQMTKFEKWQKASYFRGFNNVLMVWSSLDTGFVAMHTQKDFNDLKATGANLVILACEGTYVEDSLEYYTINYTNNDTLFTEEVLDTMVQYCRMPDCITSSIPEQVPEEMIIVCFILCGLTRWNNAGLPECSGIGQKSLVQILYVFELV